MFDPALEGMRLQFTHAEAPHRGGCMSEDFTREFALQLQKGVVDAKRKVFGPITFARVEYPAGVAATLQITIGDFCFQISTSRVFRDRYTP